MLKDDRNDTEQLRALVDNWAVAARRLNFLSEELVRYTFKKFCGSQYLPPKYEGRSKSFAIQYDVQMAQTKQLHYFSM